MFASLLFFSGFAYDASAQGTTYTVKKGDTLWKVATLHKVTVNQVKQWNNLTSNTIHVGKVLKVSAVKNVTAAKQTPPAKPTTVSNTSNKTITVTSTAYTASCRGCSGVTATGINLKKNPFAKVIAVDPKVIPLGTKVYVEGYGEAIAGDKGGAIKGHKVDVFISNLGRAKKWGKRTVKVTILE
nr:3D domain-containing protein [Bacillus ectoiniformans]